MEETISLKEVFGIIKKRLLLIITITLVAISAATFVSFYFSNTKMIPRKEKNINSANPLDKVGVQVI